jgi:oligosaccharide repeat unit polymerase
MVAIVILSACFFLCAGEQLVLRPAKRKPASPRRSAAAIYWGVTALAAIGAGIKLGASLAYVGDISTMLTTYELRAAVTSHDIAFSPIVTAMTACMYLSAALSGFLCQVRVRPRYLVHLFVAIADSVSIAGRGSFILVCMLTLLGCGIARPIAIGRTAVTMVGAALLACGLVIGLAIGRYEIAETGWEYVVGPIFGLNEYLRLRPHPGINGLTLFNGLFAKLGAEPYDPGAFLWHGPFISNVSSGFKEVFSDFGMLGLFMFLPLGIGGTWLHDRFRQRGGWGPYALALCCYSFLGFFYYVALSAFLTAWWAILFSAVGGWVVRLFGRTPNRRVAGLRSQGSGSQDTARRPYLSTF